MSMYLGDYTEDYATLNFKFTTTDGTGDPTTLLGSPVISVYKGSATGTEVTSGITLAVDFDGVTGLNNVLIDLSDAAFFEVGEDYAAIITTGSVDSISVVGYVVATFSIENRFDEVDVVKWLSQAVTLSSNNRPDVNIDEISDDLTAAQTLETFVEALSSGKVLLGAGAHGDASSVLTLERMIIESTTATEPGIKVTGNTTGAGILTTGGNNGGPGFHALGNNDGNGIYAQGVGTGAGLSLQGGTNAEALYATAGGGNNHGFNIISKGTGVAMYFNTPAAIPEFGSNREIAVGSDGRFTVSTDAQDLSGSLDVNVGAISGDTIAADNLELQYDGTGLVGDKFPSNQEQITALGGGVSLPAVAESSSVTDGTETNTYAASQNHDETLWVVTDNDNSDPGIDYYAQFDLGEDETAVLSVHFHGWYEDTNGPLNNTCAMQAYNWFTTTFETIHTLVHATSEEEHMPVLNNNHVSNTSNGPAGAANKVRTRFLQGAQDSSTGNKVSINHLVVEYVTQALTPAEVWAYATRVLTAATNITSDDSQIGVTSGVIDNVDTVDTAVPSVTVSAMDADTLTASALKADAVTEIQTGVWAKTASELTGAPAQGATFRDKVEWLATLAKNTLTLTATTHTVRNDADDGDISTATVSDSAGTTTRGEFSE